MAAGYEQDFLEKHAYELIRHYRLGKSLPPTPDLIRDAAADFILEQTAEASEDYPELRLIDDDIALLESALHRRWEETVLQFVTSTSSPHPVFKDMSFHSIHIKWIQ